MDDENLPDPPLEPLPGDCCGNGCVPCVLDIYQKELEQWRSLCCMTLRERAEWRKAELQKSSQKCVGKVALHPGQYKTFRITKIDHVTECVYKYTFELQKDEYLGLKVGQHAMLRLRDKEGVAITRPYTPISHLSQLGYFEVLIKVYEDGRLTQRLKEEWKVGVAAEWRGPLGNFSYTPNTFTRVGMLGCGTGIAPLLQLARCIVDNENDNTFVHLVYCCRTQHDILMKDELNRLAAFWNFTVLYALSSCTKEALGQDSGVIKYGDRIHFGRIGQKEVADHMPASKERTMVFICGTALFNDSMITHLTAINFTPSMYTVF